MRSTFCLDEEKMILVLTDDDGLIIFDGDDISLALSLLFFGEGAFANGHQYFGLIHFV